jgi:hypothetical protein
MKVSKVLGSMFLCFAATNAFAAPTHFTDSGSVASGDDVSSSISLELTVACQASISIPNLGSVSSGKLAMSASRNPDQTIKFDGQAEFDVASECPYYIGMQQQAKYLERDALNKVDFRATVSLDQQEASVEQSSMSQALSEDTSLKFGLTEQASVAQGSVRRHYLNIHQASAENKAKTSADATDAAPKTGKYIGRVIVAIQAL